MSEYNGGEESARGDGCSFGETKPLFDELVRSNVGCVVVLAGSGSDESHIDKIVASLRKYGIPHEVRVASAHKQSDGLLEVVKYYDSLKGALGYCAVAGNTDALSGTVGFRSLRCTVSCPPDHPNLSCIQNPPGSSNAYIGRPENVGRYFAQVFASHNKTYLKRLLSDIEKKRVALETDDARLRAKYAQQQGMNDVS